MEIHFFTIMGGGGSLQQAWHSLVLCGSAEPGPSLGCATDLPTGGLAEPTASPRSTYKHPASAHPILTDPRWQLTPPISRTAAHLHPARVRGHVAVPVAHVHVAPPKHMHTQCLHFWYPSRTELHLKSDTLHLFCLDDMLDLFRHLAVKLEISP